MNSIAKPALSINGYGQCLKADAGSITLLRGDVGSGKTLWLERIAGLLDAPDGLSIEYNGNDGKTKQNIRMLFDRHPAVWLGQTIAEELCFGLPILPSSETMKQTLDIWKIGELGLDADVQSLNHLQGIRLAMAGMDLASASLVLLDNPTDRLPVASAAELIGDIRSWIQRSDCVMVVACNRWQDWQDSAAQVWLTADPMQMPQTDSEEPTPA